MFLKKAHDLLESINETQKDMYELAEKKGLSNLDVIRISEQLDEKIILLQKMIYTLQTQQGIPLNQHIKNI